MKWKPKRNEEFYSIRYKQDSKIGNLTGWVVVKIKAQSQAVLKETIERGNCYKTEEEALARVCRIQKLMRTNPEGLLIAPRRCTVFYITHYAGRIVTNFVVNTTQAKMLRSHYNHFTNVETARKYAAMVEAML